MSPRRTILIGDLHGQLQKLSCLWERLEIELGSAAFLSSRVVFLGDYVDRGPDPAGVLQWLATLRSRFPTQEHAFLAGNHDFGMAAFLGLVSSPKEANGNGYKPWRPEPELWTPPAIDRAGPDTAISGCSDIDMHLHGRRWGASSRPGFPNVFASGTTFASYGIQEGDREGLVSAVPAEHKMFLSELLWVYESDLNLQTEPRNSTGIATKRLMACHAGLESSRPVEEQLDFLKRRDASQCWLEPLQGRRNVLELPPDLPSDTLLASGHHGRLEVSSCGRRVILDSCGGHDDRPLSAMILPGYTVIESD